MRDCGRRQGSDAYLGFWFKDALPSLLAVMGILLTGICTDDGQRGPFVSSESAVGRAAYQRSVPPFLRRLFLCWGMGLSWAVRGRRGRRDCGKGRVSVT